MECDEENINPNLAQCGKRQNAWPRLLVRRCQRELSDISLLLNSDWLPKLDHSFGSTRTTRANGHGAQLFKICSSSKSSWTVQKRSMCDIKEVPSQFRHNRPRIACNPAGSSQERSTVQTKHEPSRGLQHLGNCCASHIKDIVRRGQLGVSLHSVDRKVSTFLSFCQECLLPRRVTVTLVL